MRKMPDSPNFGRSGHSKSSCANYMLFVAILFIQRSPGAPHTLFRHHNFGRANHPMIIISYMMSMCIKLKIQILRTGKNEKFDVLITSCENGVRGGGVGCHFSPSGSNTNNKNKSPMLIPISFPGVIINKCIVLVFISYTVYNLVSYIITHRPKLR